ncbi:hypothetical protein ACFOHY_21425 [Rhizobium rosettiformans]|uniref:hypothetical protein n=1 Tax=Rhizobium rosettiformans TaxID=1368430 RepID=UPI00361389DD
MPTPSVRLRARGCLPEESATPSSVTRFRSPGLKPSPSTHAATGSQAAGRTRT